MINDGSVETATSGPRSPLRSPGQGPAWWWRWWQVRSGLRVVLTGLVRRARHRGDRGDVPGWVMVTLMTAGLVLVLWGIARDRLVEVFNHAIDSVLDGG